MGRLTRHIVPSPPSLGCAFRIQIISSRDLAHGLVACGKEDDCEEGEDQGTGARHVPTAEDNAEIFGIPGEQHLPYLVSKEGLRMRMEPELTFMLHLGPWSMPGISWSI